MFGRATLDGVEPRHAVLELWVPHVLVTQLQTCPQARSAAQRISYCLMRIRCRHSQHNENSWRDTQRQISGCALPGASVTLGSVTVAFLSQDASGDRVRWVR